jgi:hypothetical protein
MGNKVVVGIDVGKESYAVSVFDGRAYLFQGLTPAHPETFLKRVIPHLPQDAAEVLFVMEATGVYSLKLALFLKSEDPVSVVNPFVVKKYAEMLQKRTKTDPVMPGSWPSSGSSPPPPPFVPRTRRPTTLRRSSEDHRGLPEKENGDPQPPGGPQAPSLPPP